MTHLEASERSEAAESLKPLMGQVRALSEVEGGGERREAPQHLTRHLPLGGSRP